MDRVNEMIFRVSTPAQAKGIELPSLKKVSDQYGQIATEVYIKLCITDLVNNINVGDGFTKTHINTLGNFIFEDYSHLSLADIMLVLKRAKKGFYGHLYNRLDVPTVMIWFAEYEKERTKHITPY